MAQSESPSPQTEPDVEEVRLNVEGEDWTVTLLGRAGGAAAGAAPLLLVGFGPSGASGAPPTHEALIVGRTLSGVPESSLRRAFASASRFSAPEEADPVGETGAGRS
jgi:hypothetical protein